MIQVMLVIILILKLLAKVLDARGAFLQGEFTEDKEEIYMRVVSRLEREHCNNVYLKLLAPIYGL